MNTHPADGLYGLSKEILENQLACDAHTSVWLKNNGENLVPVTLKNLFQHIRQTRHETSASYWLIKRMYWRDYITLDERDYACESATNRAPGRGRTDIFHATPRQQALRVMDALLVRAKRENHPGLSR